MSTILVQCPNPACPGRSIQGQEVLREEFDATWIAPQGIGMPGYFAADIHCPRCSEEGIDPESGQLDSAEEEFGVRCERCGIVTANPDVYCRHCGKAFPGLTGLEANE